LSPFPVIKVQPGSAQHTEQLGTKEKFWFHPPGLGDCLCKLPRPNTGEDWSEKVAAELADALGLPHARYELGIYGDQNCVVSPTFLPPAGTLIHGNELLRQSDPSYGRAHVSRFQERAHTLEAVWEVLDKAACELPLAWTPPPGIGEASEVFVGYLLLDALIGNTDRHHENWGVIQTAGNHLAPTFDHASCLGRELCDRKRTDRLETNDTGFTPEAYAAKARSAFFADKTATRPMSTLEAFQRSAERWPDAARVWMEKLGALTSQRLDDIFARIPSGRCSEPSARFALRVLRHNIDRLGVNIEP
jgi:hypothetical protein